MSIKVSLFIPCIVDQFFPETGIAAFNLLRYFGCQVTYPKEQTCCGQPLFNSGYVEQAALLAEKHLNIFAENDYVVAPSGSCVTMIKHHYQDLPLSNSLERKLASLKSRIYELSEFLTEILVINEWKGHFAAKVTYHDACHALRELGIKNQPRKLLANIDGLELIEMENPETCCGFGGTFSVKYAGISSAMVGNKAGWINESGAEYVTSSDSSCLMNIDGFLRRHKIPIKSVHYAEILWRSINDNTNRT
jgi:L-lactate dehydrogenase complex protein LldE